jgi:hypothetical protein
MFFLVPRRNIDRQVLAFADAQLTILRIISPALVFAIE